MKLRAYLKSLLPDQVLAGLRTLRRRREQMFAKLRCPVCDERVVRFLPLPSCYLENIVKHGGDPSAHEPETINLEAYSCPYCGAADRDRLYTLHLTQSLRGVKPSFRLIDFAPSAPLSEWIKRKFQLEYRTADLFMEGVDDRVDLTDMSQYPDQSFDAFICSHILEHIRDDRRALGELYRILKPAGWGILMVPIDLRQKGISEDPEKSLTEADRWRHFGQGDHVRFYGKEGFIARVREAGFTVSEFGVSHFGEESFRKNMLTRKSVLYVVSKPT